MDVDYCGASTEQNTQREAAWLLGRVFPDFWEQTAAADGEFPFVEISFTARADNGRLVGHAGVMPFDVWNGDGSKLRMAGIASVAVAPEWRGHGIAAHLCEDAAQWAAENGFELSPLFTGKSGVYSGHGWQSYPVCAPRKLKAPAGSRCGNEAAFIPAMALSENDRRRVIAFYDGSFEFPGKVLRTNDRAFHAWPRIFAEPEFEFAVLDTGYALKWGGAIVECCTLPGKEYDALATVWTPNSSTVALPAEHPVWKQLEQAGWTENGAPEDVYHGESVMIRPVQGTIPPGLYFPCGDKF